MSEIDNILKHFGGLIAPEREYDRVKWTKMPDGTFTYNYLYSPGPYREPVVNQVELEKYVNTKTGASIRMAIGYCNIVYCEFREVTR